MSLTPQEALQRTVEHREIFADEMVVLFRQIMRGEVSPVMTAAILTGLRVKKETVGEIAAAASVMREFALKVEVPVGEHFVDIVGTGGDGANSFNISTASMFVTAAAGALTAPISPPFRVTFNGRRADGPHAHAIARDLGVTASTTITPSSTSTVATSPRDSAPRRSISAICASTVRPMARRIGRAPSSGS